MDGQRVVAHIAPMPRDLANKSPGRPAKPKAAHLPACGTGTGGDFQKAGAADLMPAGVKRCAVGGLAHRLARTTPPRISWGKAGRAGLGGQKKWGCRAARAAEQWRHRKHATLNERGTHDTRRTFHARAQAACRLGCGGTGNGRTHGVITSRSAAEMACSSSSSSSQTDSSDAGTRSGRDCTGAVESGDRPSHAALEIERRAIGFISGLLREGRFGGGRLDCQLRPNLVPVIGAKFLAGHPPIGRPLDGRAVLHRHLPLTVSPKANRLGRYTQDPGETRRSIEQLDGLTDSTHAGHSTHVEILCLLL